MLSRDFRLKSKSISYILRKGRRLHTSFFSLVYLPKYAQVPRFTVIISNKQVNIAPKRARIKRRMRALIALLILRAKNKGQFDIVFLPKAHVETTRWEDLLAAGEKVLAQMYGISASITHQNISENGFSRSQ